MTRTRISTLLAGLALTALSVSASSPRLPTDSPGPVTPARIRHAPIVEGCFVPPPEPVAVPPCDDRESAR
jgi:hypothetical protein